MKRPVAPFRTPPESAISHGGWLLTTSEGDVPLPSEVPHWDYQATLHLVAPVRVDRRAVTDACRLETQCGLAVVVMARSNHTNAEFLASRIELPRSETFDLAIDLRVPGENLGGRLSLETLLVATDPRPLDRLAAQQPGSILWRTSHWTDLEGSGSQFPTGTLDFAAAGMDGTAGWQFKLDLSDPDARFMSAARLTLNAGHPVIRRLLDGEKDSGTEQLLRTINWDVTRQMVQLALNSDAACELEVDPDATSVAGVLRNLLGRVWPLEGTGTLRQWMNHDPARVEVRLQHHSGLLK